MQQPRKHKWYYQRTSQKIVNKISGTKRDYNYIGEMTRSAIDFLAKEKRIPVKQF